ncbi:hypothetical protein ruthe_00791 [Rubellimicrobium thermophilum DSM 16684]|uniref:Uncharacterized protein n=1 Tax=Rubellimicrobium thermophilum DSM 16684 TaxID=1123069 RepID=S9R0J3_9RHOB|nr:hypothetical protein ruthe_00791 [Rubellimicrobium thermophilum DSM 16684]
MRCDGLAHGIVHALHHVRLQKGIAIEERERAFLLRQTGRGEIGRMRDAAQEVPGPCGGLLAAIAQPQHHQRIREPRNPQADASLGLRFGRLLGQRKAGQVHHIVQHAHGDRDQILQLLRVDSRLRAERIAHQPREVDRA